MKSVLRTTICIAAVSLAAPALAQNTGGTSMSHHHYAKHDMHHRRMSKGMHSKGDMAVEKLNEQSLMSAKGSTGGAMAPASTGSMSGGSMSSGSMTPPASGSMKSGSGLSGDSAPTNGSMQGAGSPVAGSSGMGAGTPAATGSSGGTTNQTH